MSNRPLAVGVAEAARLLGVSQRTIATLLAENKLPSLKIGRRRVILIRALAEFLHQDQATRIDKRSHSGNRADDFKK